MEIPKINNQIEQKLRNEKLNRKVKRLLNKYLIADNLILDYTNSKLMYYDIGKDKIIINPMHKDLNNYNLSESLTHEITHLIDIRNNISKKINIESELRRAELEINANSDKYNKMFENDKYAKNMTLSDIFSAVTNNRVVGKIGHYNTYWNDDRTRITKEISANIMSAYLNNNQETLNIIESIAGLEEIKRKVIKSYDKYTK